MSPRSIACRATPRDQATSADGRSWRAIATTLGLPETEALTLTRTCERKRTRFPHPVFNRQALRPPLAKRTAHCSQGKRTAKWRSVRRSRICATVTPARSDTTPTRRACGPRLTRVRSRCCHYPPTPPCTPPYSTSCKPRPRGSLASFNGSGHRRRMGFVSECWRSWRVRAPAQSSPQGSPACSCSRAASSTLLPATIQLATTLPRGARQLFTPMSSSRQLL